MAANGSTQGPLPSSLDAPVRGARMALILLLLINLFNYIDRQVLAAVEPEIREDFFQANYIGSGIIGSTVGLVASPLEQGPLLAATVLTPGRMPNAMFLMGLLSTAFLVTYMLTAPLFGWLANRMSRWVLVGIGVAL